VPLPEPSSVAVALRDAYDGMTAVVDGFDDDDWLSPSGCVGWTNADLLLHVTLDAQRALVTLASPADGPADTDVVATSVTEAVVHHLDLVPAHGRDAPPMTPDR